METDSETTDPDEELLRLDEDADMGLTGDPTFRSDSAKRFI
jgi:hypothetical protein